MPDNAIAYLVDQDPWSERGIDPGIQTALNTEFGAGNWDQSQYTTSVFTSQYNFIYIDGSDQNQVFESFIENNQTLIQNWVAAGGHLFINAAVNYDLDTPINVGFGAQLYVDQYNDAASQAYATDPGSAIVHGPAGNAGTAWSGTYFSHDIVVGQNLQPLIYGELPDGTTATVLGYESYGLGVVTIGGMTVPFYHSPQPEANILEANILAFAATTIVDGTRGPAIVGTVADQMILADSSNSDSWFYSPFNGVTITDTAAGAIDTVTITLSGGDANGRLSGAGLTHVNPGIYTLAADTPAHLTAELDALSFLATPGQVPLGQTVTTDFTLTVSDNGLTTTDTTTSLIATAVKTDDIEYGSYGRAGQLGGRGGAGGAATATSFDTSVGDYSTAQALGGTGGAGGNGASAGGPAGSGGGGGGAAATATGQYNHAESGEAYAVADGGEGGAAGAPGSGNPAGRGGSGGFGGHATASANATNADGDATADAEAYGGTGGYASGTGGVGGAGGSVSGTTATATSSGGTGNATAAVVQRGGDGGFGAMGAKGGAGAASALVNAVSGATGPGGTLVLTQTAIGGNGGGSDTGTGGAGGTALSQLSIDDTQSPTPAQAITVYVAGTGGNGGFGGAGGNGGATWDAATVTGAGAVHLDTSAQGGEGGPAGGDAQAKATGSGTVVVVTANANAGFGATVAGIANAGATGTGSAGSVEASATTGLYAGNLVTGLFASANAAVDGTNTAFAQAGIATTNPSGGGGAVAYVDALPVAAYAARATSGAPNTIAAVGGTPSVLEMGELGGGHSSLGTDSQTSTVTTEITLDLLQLASRPDLFLGFYHPGVSGAAGISDISLTVYADGASLLSEDFTSATAAKTWFSDHPIDLGSLATGPLAAGSSLALQIGLAVTTNQVGSAFTTNFLLAHS